MRSRITEWLQTVFEADQMTTYFFLSSRSVRYGHVFESSSFFSISKTVSVFTCQQSDKPISLPPNNQHYQQSGSALADIPRHTSHCMQNFTFFPYPLVFLGRIQDDRLLQKISLQHAGIQDTKLSCHVLISTICCTM